MLTSTAQIAVITKP